MAGVLVSENLQAKSLLSLLLFKCNFLKASFTVAVLWFV